ncbi:MAG: Rne/Rng family ribonuclease [Clostridia bacterium]|nr:Rne/Rng family ribonuclease [Clostridia bacterium]
MTINNKLVINKIEDKNSIFLYENGELVEQYQESIEEKRLEGNIYLGKVKNIIKGMQSAFIDIGIEKNALIHIKDIIPKESDVTGNNEINEKDYNINDYIKQGEEILVQIKKDSSKTKGARVTKDVKLVGKYIVLMPFSKFITISKKIEESSERQRLKMCVEEHIDRKQYGIIIRTSAENKKEKIIIDDIKSTIELWNGIQKKAEISEAPCELYSNEGIIGKIITDYEPLGLEIETNSEEIKKQIEKISKSVLVKIDKSINKEIEEKKKIWLKCGGFITIDKTEALIAIDVNSGKCLGKRGLEETVFKVNKEASEEIAKQLRLRDLGGIIIVDFIDMEKEENRTKIKEIMVEALKKDRSKVQIIEFTKLGLLEITRKNIYRK